MNCGPHGPVDLLEVQITRGVPFGDLVFPPVPGARPGQQTPLVFRLRHPGGRVADPLVRPAVEGVRAVRLLGRLQDQDFLVPATGTRVCSIQAGGSSLRMAFATSWNVASAMSCPRISARVGDAEQDLPARAVEEAAERLHSPVQLAGGLLELDVLPFALAIGNQLLEFCKTRASQCGHVVRSHWPSRTEALPGYVALSSRRPIPGDRSWSRGDRPRRARSLPMASGPRTRHWASSQPGIASSLTISESRSLRRSSSFTRRSPGSLNGFPLSQSAIARSEKPARRENSFRLTPSRPRSVFTERAGFGYDLEGPRSSC